VNALRNNVELRSTDAELVTSVLVRGLPGDDRQIAIELGVGEEQLYHVNGGVVEAQLHLPAGMWRIWPDLGAGVWIGATPTSGIPHMPVGASRRKFKLRDFVLRLAGAGLFLQDVQLCCEGAWSEKLPSRRWLAQLDDSAVEAIAGIVSDGADHGFEIEFGCDGLLRAETQVHADACSTLVLGLDEDR
jgi:hypothetical protein